MTEPWNFLCTGTGMGYKALETDCLVIRETPNRSRGNKTIRPSKNTKKTFDDNAHTPLNIIPFHTRQYTP